MSKVASGIFIYHDCVRVLECVDRKELWVKIINGEIKLYSGKRFPLITRITYIFSYCISNVLRRLSTPKQAEHFFINIFFII